MSTSNWKNLKGHVQGDISYNLRKSSLTDVYIELDLIAFGEKWTEFDIAFEYRPDERDEWRSDAVIIQTTANYLRGNKLYGLSASKYGSVNLIRWKYSENDLFYSNVPQIRIRVLPRIRTFSSAEATYGIHSVSYAYGDSLVDLDGISRHKCIGINNIGQYICVGTDRIYTLNSLDDEEESTSSASSVSSSSSSSSIDSSSSSSSSSSVSSVSSSSSSSMSSSSSSSLSSSSSSSSLSSSSSVDSSSSSSTSSSSSSSSIDSSSSSSSGCPDCERNVIVTNVNSTLITFTTGDIKCWDAGTLIGVIAGGEEYEGAVVSKSASSVLILLPTLSGEIHIGDRIDVCHGYLSSSSSSSSVSSLSSSSSSYSSSSSSSVDSSSSSSSMSSSSSSSSSYSSSSSSSVSSMSSSSSSSSSVGSSSSSSVDSSSSSSSSSSICPDCEDILVTNVTGVIVTATIGDEKCWTLGETVGVVYSGNEWAGNIGGITSTSISIVILTLSGEISVGNIIKVCHG